MRRQLVGGSRVGGTRRVESVGRAALIHLDRIPPLARCPSPRLSDLKPFRARRTWQSAPKAGNESGAIHPDPVRSRKGRYTNCSLFRFERAERREVLHVEAEQATSGEPAFVDACGLDSGDDFPKVLVAPGTTSQGPFVFPMPRPRFVCLNKGDQPSIRGMDLVGNSGPGPQASATCHGDVLPWLSPRSAIAAKRWITFTMSVTICS